MSYGFTFLKIVFSTVLFCHLATFPRLHFRPVLEYKFVKDARRE